MNSAVLSSMSFLLHKIDKKVSVLTFKPFPEACTRRSTDGSFLKNTEKVDYQNVLVLLNVHLQYLFQSAVDLI